MADLLTTLQRVLQDEREVFGDFLLLDPRPAPDAARHAPPEPAPQPAGEPIRPEPVHPNSQEPATEEGEPAHVSGRTVSHTRHQPPADSGEDLFGGKPMPAARVSAEPWADAATLEELDAQIHDCVKCALGHTRTKFVFGVGNPKATLMFVGEAPGADEDLQGEPFVGRAGQLLTKILAAISMQRSDVYICNILKCRPPGNRTPQADEVDQCLPYLRKQIRLVQPKLIVCLGLTAAHNLLGITESLGRLRGRVLQFEGTPLMVTYHPAALLRNPNWKAPAWEDFQAIQKLHAELSGAGQGKEGTRNG